MCSAWRKSARLMIRDQQMEDECILWKAQHSTDTQH